MRGMRANSSAPKCVSSSWRCGEPTSRSPRVLRHTRTMLQLLENAGALKEDGGWLEAEVLEWAIEEYENVA